MALHLSTPDEYTAFPYQRPYNIQFDLMRHLYTAIEQRQVTIIESPTGTGKTLSLLCSALTWLMDDKERARKGELSTTAATTSSSSLPDWVAEQIVDRRRRELEEADAAYEERLEKARKKEATLRRAVAKARKRSKPQLNDADSDDDHYLPEDDSATNEEDNISPAVRALMAKLHKTSSNDEEDDPTCTKIFYASRTHSQLTQVLPEMRRLKLRPSAVQRDDDSSSKPGLKRTLEEDDTEGPSNNIRSVALGSRKQLCINEDLRRRHGDLDEACRQLLNEKGDKRCPHLPPTGEDEPMQDLRDQILSAPKDIEELADLGRISGTCPYFGSRSAISQAQLVTLPYNLLLQQNAREALGIDLKDQVLVIDEAHNLIPTLLSLSSSILPLSTLSTALQQLSIYHSRFRTQLSTTHGLHLKRLVILLKELSVYSTQWSAAAKPGHTEIITVGNLLSRLGKNVDGINLLEITDYLRKSRIARKINGYAEKAATKAHPERPVKASANPPLHAVEAFITSLSSANEDGRIILSLSLDGEKSRMEIKYQLLNPATHFRQVLDEARCVILAGGTMSPMSDYTSQLFSHLPQERMSTFSCGHIIPSENLQAVILGSGPTGKELEFKFANRGDDTLLTELGQIILNLMNVVPRGMIVFLPSYAFLDEVMKMWKRSGAWEKMGTKKKIFMEPRDTDLEVVLREYAAEVHRQPTTDRPKPGALLLAVVGAKLSEGLNFTDDLARGVLVVGVPFPNSKSAELQERMKYVSRALPKANGGRDPAAELYENMAMNAVNQSIGRAIRHGHDWAGLILVDKRYGNARIRNKLPKWIAQSVSVPETFGGAMKTLGTFYRGRREA